MHRDDCGLAVLPRALDNESIAIQTKEDVHSLATIVTAPICSQLKSQYVRVTALEKYGGRVIIAHHLEWKLVAPTYRTLPRDSLTTRNNKIYHGFLLSCD